MKKPELLAPAGNFDALKAAIEAGCDAVYLGGYAFGARSYAGNFSDEELEQAVTYAHLYGVRIYVTVNTIVYESETELFFSYIDFLVKIHVDALILQDLGMMDYIHQVYPDLELHASTQMHIHTPEGVKNAEKFGLSRVVLARETPLEEIIRIKKNTSLDLEVFVYGALCVSYSGQCLMSSLIGGRSGNRGTCTQCCRMKYHLETDDEITTDDAYLLSTKDLNTLPYIEALLKTESIDSFKIEGRMKRPEYVYKIISLYRRAIDSFFETGHSNIKEEDLIECQKLFYRGFTKGFLLNETSKVLIRSDRPNHRGVLIGKVIKVEKKRISIKLCSDLNVQDGIRILNEKEDQGGTITTFFVNNEKRKSAISGETVSVPGEFKVEIGDFAYKTSDARQLESLKQLIDNNQRKVLLQGAVSIVVGEPLKLVVTDGEHTISITSSLPVETPLKAPISKERLELQLKKLGGSVYAFETLNICDTPFFLPIAEINEVKRQMIESLDEARIKRIQMEKKSYDFIVPDVSEQRGYSILLKDSHTAIPQQYDVIYGFDDYENDKIIPKLGNINPIRPTRESLIGEVGSIIAGMISDVTIPVTNSYTVAFLHKLGIKRITLSLEMDKEQIKDLVDGYVSHFHKKPNLEVVVDSVPEVMTSKIKLLSDYNLRERGYLVDSKNRRFPVYEDEIGIHIYHYERKTIMNSTELFDIGINYLRTEL